MNNVLRPCPSIDIVPSSLVSAENGLSDGAAAEHDERGGAQQLRPELAQLQQPGRPRRGGLHPAKQT